jgi:hypothetical protein
VYDHEICLYWSVVLTLPQWQWERDSFSIILNIAVVGPKICSSSYFSKFNQFLKFIDLLIQFLKHSIG